MDVCGNAAASLTVCARCGLQADSAAEQTQSAESRPFKCGGGGRSWLVVMTAADRGPGGPVRGQEIALMELPYRGTYYVGRTLLTSNTTNTQ